MYICRLSSFLLSVGSNDLQILNEIGQGSYGRVYRAVWMGTIVAAKEALTAGNEKVLAKELSVYR